MSKSLAFTDNATPPTCYIAGSRDSGILTSLRPSIKLILKSRFWVIWGHRGQKFIFTKNASLHTITLYGHVTYAYKQA